MSITYAGIIAFAIAWLAKVAGIEIASAQTQAMAENILSLVGIFVALYGRYRIGDLKWFGARK